MTGLWITSSAFTLGRVKLNLFFSLPNRKRKIGTLDIQYGDAKIKQHSKVLYLGCELDERLSGEVTDGLESYR